MALQTEPRWLYRQSKRASSGAKGERLAELKEQTDGATDRAKMALQTEQESV